MSLLNGSSCLVGCRSGHSWFTGEADASLRFARTLESRFRADVTVPELGQTVDLG